MAAAVSGWAGAARSALAGDTSSGGLYSVARAFNRRRASSASPRRAASLSASICCSSVAAGPSPGEAGAG
jgi:hypothetical protein